MCRQLGTLGAGNHYAEIQVVDEIYNEFNARKMGIEFKGQVRHGAGLCGQLLDNSLVQIKILFTGNS